MTLKDEKDKFQLVAKRILKENLSNNKETLLGYKDEIVKVYNENITYIKKNYDRLDNNSQKICLDFVEYIRRKLLQCLERLQFSYKFSEDVFTLITLDAVVPIEDADKTLHDTPSDSEDDTLILKILT